MLTMLRRLLPLAVLLTLGIQGVYAQLDCGHPVDVPITAGSPSQCDIPGQRRRNRLYPSVGQLGGPRLHTERSGSGRSVRQCPSMPRARNQVPGQVTAGATPIDLAGGVYQGENFTGWEFDLSTDGTFYTAAGRHQPQAAASLHVVLTRLNRPCAANTTLTCGRSLAGAISTTVPGQVDTYQYSVQSGDVVSFRLLRVATSGLPNTSTGFFFAIYAADPTQNNRPFVVNVDPTTGRLPSRPSTAGMIGRPPSPAPSLWWSSSTPDISAAAITSPPPNSTAAGAAAAYARLQLHRRQLADQPPYLRLLHDCWRMVATCTSSVPRGPTPPAASPPRPRFSIPWATASVSWQRAARPPMPHLPPLSPFPNRAHLPSSSPALQTAAWEATP